MKKCIASLVVGAATLAATAQAQTVFSDDFGSSATRTTSPYVPQDNGPFVDPVIAGQGNFSHGSQFYKFAEWVSPDSGTNWDSNRINDGYYAVVVPQDYKTPANGVVVAPGNEIWTFGDSTVLKDHTTGTAAALMVNAGMVTNVFYRRPASLAAGKVYTLSAWRWTQLSTVSMRMEVHNGISGTSIGQSPDFEDTTDSRNWQQYRWSFQVPTGCASSFDPSQLQVAFRNMRQQVQGNDFLIDDILLVEDASGANPTVLPCPTLTPMDDAATTPVDTAVKVPVIANDTGSAPIDPASVRELTPPANGSITVDATTGEITYTPNAGFTGTDSFEYNVCDTSTPVNCAKAKVTVTVNPAVVTPALTPMDDTATTTVGTAVTVPVIANDTGSTSIDPASVRELTPPANGSTTVNTTTGAITYTPNAGFTGTDSFEYNVCDTSTPVNCGKAKVTITVNPTQVTATATPVPVDNPWALGALAGALVWLVRRRRA